MDYIGVSKEDLLAAVEVKLGHNAFNISSYVLEEVEEKIGLLGDHAFIRVTVFNQVKEKEEMLSFFVKLFPTQETLGTFARGAGAFPREEFIYEILHDFRRQKIDIINSCTCVCYGFKPSKYLILDDLEIEGFRMPNKADCLDYDTLLLVLHHMSQFHAASLIYEEQKTKKLGHTFRIIDGNEDRLKETLYCDSDDFLNRDAIAASFNCILTELQLFDFPQKLKSGRDFLECVKDIYPMIYQLVKPSQNHRNVLCHGDLWASNFLLKSDQEGKAVTCKLVDFQSVRYVPPAHDVISFIYLNTSRKLRKERMYEAIGVYYSYLEKHIKKSGFNLEHLISFENFLDSCEEQKLFAVLFAAGILPLILGNREKIEQYFEDPELYRKVFREDRSVLVYDNQNSEWYMKRLKESIEDLKEECERFE